MKEGEEMDLRVVIFHGFNYSMQAASFSNIIQAICPGWIVMIWPGLC